MSELIRRLLNCRAATAAALILSSPFVLSAQSPPGLVAAYAFSEGAGGAVGDSSGAGNNGAIANATWATAGKYGSALVFNGSNSWVTIADAPSLRLTSAMTLEAWVNPTTVTAAWRDVVYKGNDNYALEATSGNNRPSGGGLIGGTFTVSPGTAALQTNAWSHIAVTFDGSTIRFYLNGVQVSTKAKTGAITASANPLQIGGDRIYGQYFSGLIDEVRVYNVALTAAQIVTDMNTPVGNPPADTQPPSTPLNLTATAVSGTQINLGWAASTDNVGVTAYLLERCTGAACTNFAQIAAPTGTAYSDPSLTAGASYSYRVRARDGAGNASGYSSIASTTTLAPDTQPPSTPLNLTATAVSGTQINLGWAAATDNVGVTAYLLERCAGAACTNFAQIATPAGTSSSDTALTAGTSYSYRVRATDAAGNLGGYSNIASTTTLAPDTQPPSAPSTLTATVISGGQLNLSWSASTDNVGVAGYRLERCQGTACSVFTQVAAPAGTSYNDTGLSPNTSYSYRVRAADAAGNLSPYSNVASGTTLAVISGLVAAYGFNEGAGTTLTDASGNGVTGTMVGATWSTAGKYGNALSFNGTSSYVDLGNPASLQLTGSMTWSAWINAAANPPDDGQIIAKSDNSSGWQLKTTPDTGSHTFGVS
ncbi:MAG: LamG-like jellyroll fold domain-containing protein, partial [Bryobacteraceae bacterium]